MEDSLGREVLPIGRLGAARQATHGALAVEMRDIERSAGALSLLARWELRRRLREKAVSAVVHATGSAAGMVRIVGADVLRDAGRCFARRADS
jgi:hypothetical protein